MRAIRKILASIRRADETFSLIDKGDRILLGVSGGKDSLCLLKALSIYSKFAQKDFEIVPVMLDLGFPDFNAEKILAWGKENQIEIFVEDAREVYPILEANKIEGKHIPCSICSRMKKAAIGKSAHEHHCNKIAFAHHKDDAIETLFMNLIHGGRVATFQPKMFLSRLGLEFIRPLIFAKEEDLKTMAIEEALPVMGKICGADGLTEREIIKNQLKKIYEKYEEGENNLEKALYNYPYFKLYFDDIELLNHQDNQLSLHPLTSANDVLSYDALAKKHPELSLFKLGGKSYLIYQKHRLIGGVQVYYLNSHTIEIKKVDILKEEKACLKDIVSQIIELYSVKINPVLFIYQAKGKKDVASLGFKVSQEIGPNFGQYCLKVKRG